MNIPMSSPFLTDEDIQEVLEVLTTRYLSVGPKLGEFEQEIAKKVGRKYAVGVNSGTSALHLAVIGAGIKPRDLVITTPFSFISSANCMLFEGAIPVFVDIDPLTCNIDPELVSQAAKDIVSGGKAAQRWLPPSMQNEKRKIGKLKALLPVDIFGQPADYDQLCETSDTFDLCVIEDSCEALGAEYKDKAAGALGDVGVFAFYPNKQITTGEGGMLVTDDDELANLYRSLRNQGRDVFDVWLNHNRLGYNYRMDEMSAALGLSQFRRIDDSLARRAQVATWYYEKLDGIPDLRLPIIASTTTHMSWFVFVVQFPSRESRDRVMHDLDEMGIPSRPYFSPIHLQPFYIEKFGYQRGDFPFAEQAGDCCLALPFSGIMTEEQVGIVAGSIRELL